MRVNNMLNKVIALSLIFLVSCSAGNKFVTVDYSNNANLEIMEQEFFKSSGSGKLIAKGQSNFVSRFDFISTKNSSSILFKDFLGRKQFLVEIINQDIRYIDMKKRQDIDIENFSNFFPIATKIDANTYKKLMWGIPDTFKDMDVAVKNKFMISTRLNTLDGRNLINDLIFSFNNNKQEYKLIFLDRKFFEEDTKL